jgi:hypothetical protein
MEKGTTLTRFIVEEERRYPEATGEFTSLLSKLTIAGKIIAREVNKAGLADIMGITGRRNVHGEEVQKLDEFANATIIRGTDHTGHLAGMVSEEMEYHFPIPEKHIQGNYILVFDSVDGSSNIDVNVSIGAIFSIFRKKSPSGVGLGDFLRPGSEQLCAGYILYGSSTVLVYTTGNGAHGFTLDPTLGAIAALLCGEDVRLWHDQLLYKPPSSASAPQSVGWHTDYGYWRTCSADHMLTAWVPFTDMDEQIGTISFVEGSLHWPTNNHLNCFSSDLDGLEKQFQTGGAAVEKKPAILQRGQVTFHHCRTIHGSGPNLTQAPRRSLALHLQPASNTYRQVYDDGHLTAHPNDDLTRGQDNLPNYTDPTYCPAIGQIDQARALHK